MEALAGLGSLLVIGTVWFYVLIAVWTFYLFWCVEEDRGVCATVSTIAVFALMGYAGNFNVISWARENPGWAGLALAAYFACGVGWSFGKWYAYTRRQRAKYDEAHEAYLRRVDPKPLADAKEEAERQNSIVAEWRKIANGGGQNVVYSPYGTFEFNPKASRHKKRILIWSIYWPWSFTWTIINDPVKEVFDALYRRMQRWYQAISDNAFKGTENDFKVK